MARPASKSTSPAAKSRAGTKKRAAPKTVARTAATSARGGKPAAKPPAKSAARKGPPKKAAQVPARRGAARKGARFDAVTMQILWTRLISIVNEASAALVRTSFSALVREAYDFSVIITDERGQGVVQPPASIPAFIGTLPSTVRHILAEFPAEVIRQGDIFITNDPWKGTGHLADVSVAKPIFVKGVLVGFAASVAHAPDMGGRTGSTESRDVFEEGFQIPVMRLASAGKPDATFIKILRANVRTPDEVVGDLYAQISALELMERRTIAMLREYGLDSLTDIALEIHERSEAAMRAAIREIPDGTYRYEIQTDGLDDPMSIKVAVKIKGDEIVVDYAGTSPQVDRALNSALCYTTAYTMYGLKCVLSPDIPNNEGSFRPIRIEAPLGSIINHKFPTSGCSRAMLGHYLPFAVLGALSSVIPDRVMAGPGSPIWSVLMRGTDRHGRAFSNKLFFNGGVGANQQSDGMSCVSWPSNISLTPAEVVEQLTPARVVYKRLRPGSGGPGKHRGGLGQDILIENGSSSPMVLAFLAERTKFAAPGIAGGGDGALGALRINGEAADPKRQHVLRPGGTILMSTPGGGGYGPADERSAEAIARDARLGFAAAD